MSQKSLLLRVKEGDLAEGGRSTDADLRNSVLEHLKIMCATRRGTMATCPDYGICDVSELIHGSEEATSEMEQSIKHTIQKYEPRLANVRVRFDSQHLEHSFTMRFEITAQLVGPAGKSPVTFETTVDATRRIHVR